MPVPGISLSLPMTTDCRSPLGVWSMGGNAGNSHLPCVCGHSGKPFASIHESYSPNVFPKANSVRVGVDVCGLGCDAGDLASAEHRAALDHVVHQYASRVECLAGTAAPSFLSPVVSPTAASRSSPKKAFVFAYSDPGAGAVVAPFGVVAFREITRLVEVGSGWRRAGDAVVGACVCTVACSSVLPQQGQGHRHWDACVQCVVCRCIPWSHASLLLRRTPYNSEHWQQQWRRWE